MLDGYLADKPTRIYADNRAAPCDGSWAMTEKGETATRPVMKGNRARQWRWRELDLAALMRSKSRSLVLPAKTRDPGGEARREEERRAIGSES